MTQAPLYTHPVRVYWEDTDAGGIVFYANYLKFFERARTEWLRSMGFGQQQLRDEQGAMFVVIETQVRYKQPARLDDLIDVTVQLGKTGPVALTLVQQALRQDGTVMAEGSIRIACVDAGTFRPRAIPKPLFDLLA